MENKKGFYDEIYENYKNLSLAEVEELLLRCNEEEKESFIRMLERCCLKRDLKKELIEEEIQEKEKIEQNCKEAEKEFINMSLVSMVIGIIEHKNIVLELVNFERINPDDILIISAIMVYGALFLRSLAKYIFYRKKYKEICKEAFLETKIGRFNCDSFLEISVMILFIFIILIGTKNKGIYVVCAFVLIYCFYTLNIFEDIKRKTRGKK